MANNRISVLIDVTVDKANRALTDFKTKVAEADGAVGKFKAGTKSAMDSLRANSGAAATVAGAALFKFGKDAVDAASSLEQSIGGIEKSFGDAAESVLAIGRNADESMGLSERAFNEGALALSAFAEDIAKDTGEPIEKVITDLMTRAADFAAAYGTTVPEAVRIFSSTLSGESEPIKRFGIIVNETETKAYAAEAGIEDMGKATQRAGLLMQDTAKFAGQFADEGDTLAGSQARLGAKIENLQAQLGEELLPIIADVTSGVGDLIDGWNTLGELPPVKMVIEVTGNDSLLGLLKDGLDKSAGIPGLNYAVGKITGTFKKWDSVTLATTGTIGDLTGEVDGSTEATEDATDATDGYRFSHENVGRAIDATTQKISHLRDELSDRSAYLSAQEGLKDVADQAVETGAVSEEAIIDAKNQLLDYAETLDDEAAKERVTTLATELDAESYYLTAVALAELEKERTVRLRVALGTASGATSTGRIGGIPLYAHGTSNHPGGPAIVGDGGEPEIVNLPKGSTVTPLSAIPTAGGGGNVYNSITIYTSDPEGTVNAIKKYARRNGPGSVSL